MAVKKKRKKSRGTRIAKSATGLTLQRGKCKVVKGRIKVCVSKSGAVSVTGATLRRAGKKKSAGGAKPKSTRTSRPKKKCVSATFTRRLKGGKSACACLVRGKSGVAIQTVPSEYCDLEKTKRTLTTPEAKRLYEVDRTFQRGYGTMSGIGRVRRKKRRR